MQLVPKRQIGGNLYKIDNTMPQITQRYVALLNKGVHLEWNLKIKNMGISLIG